jgi:hypothetical protein
VGSFAGSRSTGETALAPAPATGYVATPAIGAEMGAASMADSTAGSASIDGSYGFITGYRTESAASQDLNLRIPNSIMIPNPSLEVIQQ